MDDEVPSLDAVVFRYTDKQAIADGALIPWLARRGDSGHRITANA